MDDKDLILAAQEARIQQLGRQVTDLQKLVGELSDDIARKPVNKYKCVQEYPDNARLRDYAARL